VQLETLMVVREDEARKLSGFNRNLVPLVRSAQVDVEGIKEFRMVEIPYGGDTLETTARLKKAVPGLLVSVRMPALSRAEQVHDVVKFTRAGLDVIHYAADEHGYEPGIKDGLHLKDLIKEVHAALLHEGLRDEITVMASGGIAMAEHVIKSMLCGANLVSIDVPILIALECRVCRNCRDGGECPVHLAQSDSTWGSQRIVNLIGAWHNQFLEMMGAMGIREARRLRGEQGRVMFKEDLEYDTFAQLFAHRNS
jgi:glutamate synthase domain-containing protein 2